MIKILKSVFSILPFKRQICFFFKANNIGRKYYYALRFDGPFKTRIKDSYFQIYNNKGVIENEIFWNGLFNTWETEMGDLWCNISEESTVVFDIGANTGIYSLISKALNPNAEIHAFEPSRKIFQDLKNNVHLNHFDIKTNQIALSNQSGTQLFYDSDNRFETGASLAENKLVDSKNHKVVSYEVETLTLDDYIHQNEIEKIDLMKIDVELYEAEVLQGFQKYLTQFKPIIFIEVLNQDVSQKLNNLLDIEDYYIFNLSDKSKLEKFEPFKDQWNFLLFHKERKNTENVMAHFQN